MRWRRSGWIIEDWILDQGLESGGLRLEWRMIHGTRLREIAMEAEGDGLFASGVHTEREDITWRDPSVPSSQHHE